MSSRHLVDPELLGVLEAFPKAEFSNATLAALRAVQLPFAVDEVAIRRVSLTERSIPGPAGCPDVGVLIFAPHEFHASTPCIVHMHGGGYVVGSAASVARSAASVAPLSTSTWTSIGPAPLKASLNSTVVYSGRITGIAAHPIIANTIYIAAAGGGAMPRSLGAAATPTAAQFRGRDTKVGDVDLSSFQQIHAAVQEAWGRGDLGQMRRLMTPEMLSYFSEELTRSASQGVQNIVSDVRLLKGDVSEAWEEGDLEYATAFLRWSANDYVVRLDRSPGQPDYLVSGDPKTPTEAEENWTFVRRRGADWLLSAIQQV